MDYERRPDQIVHLGDIDMPRGQEPGRPCDVKGCPQPALELIGRAGGSVLFVCLGHSMGLTGYPPDGQVQVKTPDEGAEESPDDRSEASGEAPNADVPGQSGPGDRAERRSLHWSRTCGSVAGMVLLGVAVLICLRPGDDAHGVLTGWFGACLLYKAALPRYR